jgi:UDPglucose 6-dehydrogenase
MQIAIVGAGYVGLVTGACLADFGHHVNCIDEDATRIDMLNAGRVPLYEPGLDKLIVRNHDPA